MKDELHFERNVSNCVASKEQLMDREPRQTERKTIMRRAVMLALLMRIAVAVVAAWRSWLFSCALLLILGGAAAAAGHVFHGCCGWC